MTSSAVSSRGASAIGMAMAAAVALLCYAVILFVPRLTGGSDR